MSTSPSPGPVQRRFINNIMITTRILSPSLQVAACGWSRMGDFIRVIQHKRYFDHLQIQFLHSQTEQGRLSPCITLPGNTGVYLVHLARTWRTLGSRLSIHRLTGQYWQMQRFMANVWRLSETCNSTFYYLILSEPFDFCEINVFIFLICQLAAGLMGRSSGHFLSAQF